MKLSILCLLIVDFGNPIIGKMEEIKSDMSQCKIWTGGKKVVILQCFRNDCSISEVI